MTRKFKYKLPDVCNIMDASQVRPKQRQFPKSDGDVKKYLRDRIEEDSNGCHIWQSSVSKNGYGRATTGVNSGQMTAHRLSYIAHKGPIEDETMQVSHLCHQKLCVNPDHLVLETQPENLRRNAMPPEYPTTSSR